MEEEQKVATEVSEHEFMRFLCAMDLDFKADESKMDSEDKQSFRKAKQAIVRAIDCGALLVEDDGSLTFTPRLGAGGPIRFKEPNGGALLAMDKFKRDESVHRTYAVLAEMTGQPSQRFAKLARRDMAVCEAVFGLFFG